MSVKVVIYLVSLLLCSNCNVHCESSNSFADLCIKNNSDISYNEYTTSATSLCDCIYPNHCLRKCCQFGFFHNFTADNNSDAKCIRNTSTTISNFTVILYDGTVRKSKTNIFVIGMLQCNNTNMIYQYFKMNNRDPMEKYFLQTNGSLYYPNSQTKYYNTDRFCVDEEDGLTVYLCYTPDGPEKHVSRLINSSGIHVL